MDLLGRRLRRLRRRRVAGVVLLWVAAVFGGMWWASEYYQFGYTGITANGAEVTTLCIDGGLVFSVFTPANPADPIPGWRFERQQRSFAPFEMPILPRYYSMTIPRWGNRWWV